MLYEVITPENPAGRGDSRHSPFPDLCLPDSGIALYCRFRGRLYHRTLCGHRAAAILFYIEKTASSLFRGRCDSGLHRPGNDNAQRRAGIFKRRDTCSLQCRLWINPYCDDRHIVITSYSIHYTKLYDTGASGEIRSTVPHTYSSIIRSPTTRTRHPMILSQGICPY